MMQEPAADALNITSTLRLHANWHVSSLYLWGTAADGSALQPLPLREAVGELSADSLIASVATDSMLNLWLPTDGTLTAQTVPSLQLSPSDAIDLLSSLPEPAPEAAG